MTSVPTNDPHDRRYLDEADTRAELTRVFDQCQGCRRCVDLCTTFPSLFELLDRFDDGDAGRLTPDEQDRVVDRCFHCDRCVEICPYAPGRDDDLRIDVPAATIRAAAMRHASGLVGGAQRRATPVLTPGHGRGRLARLVAPVTDRLLAAPPGSLRRRALARTCGVTSAGPLPERAAERWSTRFRRRTPDGEPPDPEVIVLATCALEHEAPDAGRDLVALLHRAGVGCELAEVGCCGAPLLHAGDLDRFRRAATATLGSLAGDDRPVLVADPVCRTVLARSYPEHVALGDRRVAADVAVRVVDPASVVVDLVREGRLPVPDPAPGSVARVVHVAEHAADACGSARVIVELLERIGVAVDVVERTVGAGVTWGWRRGHHEEAERLAVRAAKEAVDALEAARGSALVTADDARVAHALRAHVGHRPSHPLSAVARRLGVVSD